MRNLFPILCLAVVAASCNRDPFESPSETRPESNRTSVPEDQEANHDRESEIRSLIELLVFSDGPASNRPIVDPNMKIVDADGNAKPISGASDDAEKRRQKFNACQQAFNKLYEMKEVAIPFLVEHLDDDRQSINFRNHYTGNSVGDACFWNIYYQLVDQPNDYSEYGYSRMGRDGQNHPKPYWEGTPFDDVGGLKTWLQQNSELNYLEMQIKCLRWLLEREKQIGAADSDSYFRNILPLEIRILERRKENGDDVDDELARLVRIRDNKLADEVPQELLPDR
jgi:hypothetical protein